jgi:uncharacterized membrane protein
MSTLVAVAYPDQHRATEVLSVLQGLQREQKIDLEDSLCVIRAPNGNVEYVQGQSSVGKKVVGGGVGGLLVGMFLLAPVVGVAVGAGAGLVAARKSHQGIDNTFASKVGSNIEPGGSALVLLVRSSDREAVHPAISGYGGTLIESGLDPEIADRLQSSLSAGGPGGAPLEARVDVPIGAIVYCSDGIGGKVKRALINPLTMEVRHIAVRVHDSIGHDYIVPIDLIEASTSGEVRLRLTRAELAEMPTYRYSSHSRPLGADESVVGDKMAYNSVGWNSMSSEWDMLRGADEALPEYIPDMETFEDGVPPGEFSISQGDDVRATDGKVGKVDQLLMSRENGMITHLVMRDGHMWGKKAIPIPVSDIASLEQGLVLLRLSKEQVAALPEIPLGRWKG